MSSFSDRTVKVHYRLAVADERCGPTGAYLPPANVELPEGDIRKRVLRAPDDIPYPPTSGNAFSAAALRRLLTALNWPPKPRNALTTEMAGAKSRLYAGTLLWAVPGSNQRPPACKAGALPAELTARTA